jgi:hypothetical protein
MWNWLRRLLDPFDIRSLSNIVGTDRAIAQELPDVVPFFKIWRKKATGFRILHALLGVLSVFFSLLTTTVLQFEGSNWNSYAKIFAFIAAVSIGLMTAFNLGTKSNDMTRAWRKLTAAVIRFNKGLITKEKVIDEYVEAERLIGDVTFDQSLVPTDNGGPKGNRDDKHEKNGADNKDDKHKKTVLIPKIEK